MKSPEFQTCPECGRESQPTDEIRGYVVAECAGNSFTATPMKKNELPNITEIRTTMPIRTLSSID
ncbi:MAG: hypothetical protein CL726_02270 [Chloroflexi bacterium]|jgi:hypothetical protein|nr:hypothetical protein [Chloroflexota bacterium]